MMEIILRTQELLNLANCTVQHCYREANQVADALAGWSIDNVDQIFHSSNKMPQKAMGLYRLDMIQMASFRHKHRKFSFL